MAETIVQIYEIQTPLEAELLIDAGVDHIGSVILSEETWKIPAIRDTINLVRKSPAKSSLIPLFSDMDSISTVIEYYQPDMIHLCEDLACAHQHVSHAEPYVAIQQRLKNRFPEIRIIRSIPIPPPETAVHFPVLELAEMFASCSDYFLTDTLLLNGKEFSSKQQPVTGFVGITGKTCDWRIAGRLVAESTVPVILAGGMTPLNVAKGIKQVRPAGVDSCTGTNALDEKRQPIRFKKDVNRVTRFVRAARACAI